MWWQLTFYICLLILIWYLIPFLSSSLLLGRFYSATACSDPGIVYTYTEVVNSSTQRARSPNPNEGNIEDGIGGGGSFHGSDAGVGSVSSGSSGRRKHTDTDRTGSTQTPAPEPEAPPPVALIQCGQCSIDRPVTAAHCYECGVCVDELDHHCPVWATKNWVCVCLCDLWTLFFTSVTSCIFIFHAFNLSVPNVYNDMTCIAYLSIYPSICLPIYLSIATRVIFLTLHLHIFN